MLVKRRGSVLRQRLACFRPLRVPLKVTKHRKPPSVHSIRWRGQFRWTTRPARGVTSAGRTIGQDLTRSGLTDGSSGSEDWTVVTFMGSTSLNRSAASPCDEKQREGGHTENHQRPAVRGARLRPRPRRRSRRAHRSRPGPHRSSPWPRSCPQDHQTPRRSLRGYTRLQQPGAAPQRVDLTPDRCSSRDRAAGLACRAGAR